jgi:hypothetical protein
MGYGGWKERMENVVWVEWQWETMFSMVTATEKGGKEQGKETTIGGVNQA